MFRLKRSLSQGVQTEVHQGGGVCQIESFHISGLIAPVSIGHSKNRSLPHLKAAISTIYGRLPWKIFAI